jgi:type III secretory pathway component EscU
VSSKVVQEVDIGRSLYGIMNGGEVYPEEYFEEARAMF